MAYTRKDNSSPVPSPAKPAIPQVRSRFAGLSSSAVALFRVGTYRARMAAALLIVAGSLLYQTGAEAMQESSKKVLYLDAPSVSVPQAEKAGETARGYAGPDSNVDDAVLAWVDVKPVPLEARKAFASITDPSGQPPGGVSYDDAVAAGDAMVAQLGGDSPAPPDGEDDELASADPVRPKLGDGTKAAGTSESDDEDQRPNIGSEPESAAPESGSQDPRYAAPDNPAPSDLGLPAPMAEEYAPEPSMDSPATPPAEQPPDSSGDELAAVPEDGSEGTEEGAGGNSETGPISDGYAPDTATPDPSGDDPSDGSADEAEPQDEKEPGSPDAGPDPQEDETFPKIVVSDSPTPDEPEQAPEQEYAAVPAGSGTDPETSETPEPETETSNPADTVTPQDEPSNETSDEISSDLSSEPSPSSTGEESVPTQDTSPGTDEQDPEILPDLVAVVPYDSGAEESQGEGQEGLEQSSQPPAAPTAAPTAEPSSGPSTDEADSYSLEPGRQEAVPEQATATSMSEEQQTEGEDTALQPEAGPSAELGSGEDTEDTGTEEELPEGVQVESSDESGAQKLSVVVHQESEAADTPANNSSDAQDTPEPTPSTPTESEQSSPAPQEGGDRPSAGPGESTNPEQPDDAPGRSPGDQQQPAPQTSPEPGPAAHNQDRRGDQRTDEERVTGQEPGTSTPNPAPAPKDQRPRQSGEEASQARNPTQNKDSGEEKQQPPQPEQQQPAQLAREPRQSTAPAKASPATPSPVERGEDNGVQGPTQSAEAVQISAQPEPRTEPQAESIPAQDSQPPTPTAATNTPQSNEAVPAPQNQPVVTAEPVIQPPAASQAEPEAAPEAAPAVQTPVEPVTEEVADPAGWADPTQAARQTTRQVNQAMDQAADQISVQPANAATQSYAAPAAEQVWDQVVQPEAGGVQGQWTADTDVSDQAYPVQDAGMQASGMVESVNQANQVDSYTQEALGSISEITTPPENIADPYADPYAEPSTESSTVPAETSYEAPAVPAVQDVTGAVEDATQDGYLQNAADPYVEDATVDAAPASQPVPEHVAYGGAVDSTSYEDSAALPETYAAPTPTETYAEPVTQIPVQQLEPVQQVPTQQLDPAPQAADVLDSGPTVAQPSPDPTNSASGATSPAPAQQAHQQVASTVDTAIQQTIGAEGTTGGGK